MKTLFEYICTRFEQQGSFVERNGKLPIKNADTATR